MRKLNNNVYMGGKIKKCAEDSLKISNDKMNQIDLEIDVFNVLKINEMSFYKNNLIYNDKSLRKKIKNVIEENLNLPDDYVTIINNRIVENGTIIIHYELMMIFFKLQKKYYNEDKFGINAKDVVITSSFFEDMYYICEVYNSAGSKNSKYIQWINNYNSNMTYFETAEYKFYGGSDERIINK
jgi:hypothetical protein